MDFQELLELTKQNNLMLRAICLYLGQEQSDQGSDDAKDFIMNVIANIVSNKVHV